MMLSKNLCKLFANLWFLISALAICFSTGTPTEDSFLSFQSCVLNKGLSLDYVLTEDSNETLYEIVNHQWNLRLTTVDPLAYFLPKSTRDVKVGVKCASKFNIRVIPQSGGHSFEGYSFGNSATIIIDFRFMTAVKVNANSQTATIEAGALLGPISAKLWNSGDFGWSLGGCVTLGIAGYTLGGGTGLSAAAYGLAIDNVIEMKMVAADGKSYKVSANSNPELFWGLLGVGSGYLGIVTSFKFKLFPADNMKITHLTSWYDMNQSAQIMEAWQNWTAWTNANSPGTMSSLSFGPIKNTTRGTGIRMRSYHFQDGHDYTEGNATFISMYNAAFPSPVMSTMVLYSDYMDFVLKNHFALTLDPKPFPLTQDVLENLGDDLLNPRYMKRHHFFVKELFTSEQFVAVGEAIEAMPESNLVSVSVWYEGGKVSSIPINATSYVHRSALYTVYFEYSGPNNQELIAEAVAWIQMITNATNFMDSGESYQNYVDEALGNSYLERYYGSNLERLVQVKNTWDLENYFQIPQSIPTSI